MKFPRILVIRGGAIGDFIMTLPVLAALRERWPAAHLEVLGYPHIAGLAAGYVNGTRSMSDRALAGFFVPNGILDPNWMDYFASFAAVISYLFDPDEIFANNVKRCGVKQYIPGAPKPTDLPAARHYCRALEALAIYVDAPVPRVNVVAGPRTRTVVIHPGSGSEKKNWPVEKFGSLGRWVVDELNLPVAVVQGEADEKSVARLLAELSPRLVRVLAGLKLPELAVELAQCGVFVGNDSGITHLAAAVGTPVVAMFGPASPAIWQPPQPNARVIAFGPTDLPEVRRTMIELFPR
ncbi:MAG: hypothetical protein PCFJNLEI_03868 [Verrucomicrobiae bacterium]|nr:hypothetical protein [Verrucomicrobiae bacterium]